MPRTLRLLAVLILTTAIGASAARAEPLSDPGPTCVPAPCVPAGGWAWRAPPRPRCRRFGVEVEGGAAWQSRNDAAVPGDTGTRFALDDLVGAGPFAAARVTLTWDPHPRHGFRLLAAPLSLSGSGPLDRDVDFAGTSFSAGVDTEGTFRFNSWRLTYRYRLVASRCFCVKVGFTAKVRDAEIRLEQAGRSAKKTDVGFVPLLHLDVDWRFRPRWHLHLEADGLAAEQGRALDASLKLHYDLTERWNVGVGYRTIEGGADNDEVYTFTWLHQAVVSVGYRF